MRLNWKIVSITLATVLALTVGIVWTNVAWAQGTTDSSEEEGRMPIRQEVRQAGIAAAAELLGMTPEELSDQLWGGKTLADLAEEKGVALADLRAAVEEATSAARQERIQVFIAEQVAAGRMSQERADWILEGIENHWFRFDRLAGRFGGFGDERFGMGHGRGMGRMRMHERGVQQDE